MHETWRISPAIFFRRKMDERDKLVGVGEAGGAERLDLSPEELERRAQIIFGSGVGSETNEPVVMSQRPASPAGGYIKLGDRWYRRRDANSHPALQSSVNRQNKGRR